MKQMILKAKIFAILTVLLGLLIAACITEISSNKLDAATIDRIVKSKPSGIVTSVPEVIKKKSAKKVDEVKPAKPTEPATEPATAKPSEISAEDKDTKDAEETTYNYSEDTDLLARVIYLESDEYSEHCQWLVGCTAMNLADERGGLANVAYDYNTFNVAYQIDDCTPSELSLSIAKRILSGDRDYVVKAFRDDYYHSWATPYMQVDNMYFSTY